MWREEKERKTETEVDGQCECGLESNVYPSHPSGRHRDGYT